MSANLKALCRRCGCTREHIRLSPGRWQCSECGSLDLPGEVLCSRGDCEGPLVTRDARPWLECVACAHFAKVSGQQWDHAKRLDELAEDRMRADGIAAAEAEERRRWPSKLREANERMLAARKVEPPQVEQLGLFGGGS